MISRIHKARSQDSGSCAKQWRTQTFLKITLFTVIIRRIGCLQGQLFNRRAIGRQISINNNFFLLILNHNMLTDIIKGNQHGLTVHILGGYSQVKLHASVIGSLRHLHA